MPRIGFLCPPDRPRMLAIIPGPRPVQARFLPSFPVSPRRLPPLRITAYTTTTAAGAGRAALLSSLKFSGSALRPNDFGPSPLATWIGRVDAIESTALPRPLASWDCRNNRLAWLGLVADDFIDAVQDRKSVV